MFLNPLRQKIADGKAVIGPLFQEVPDSPDLTEFLGCAGFDYVMVDGEHAGVEVEFANADFPSAKAEQEAKSDVESRVHEIANDVIEEREWATEEEFDNYDDELDEELEERRSRDDADY